jgi:hypothetical protein
LRLVMSLMAAIAPMISPSGLRYGASVAMIQNGFVTPGVRTFMSGESTVSPRERGQACVEIARAHVGKELGQYAALHIQTIDAQNRSTKGLHCTTRPSRSMTTMPDPTLSSTSR